MHLKYKIDLRILAPLIRVLRYLGDPHHPNHIFYRVTPVFTWGGGNVADVLIRAIAARDEFNSQNPRNARSGAMTWKIISCAPSSWITEMEVRTLLSTVATFVAPGQPILAAWHQHLFNGASDLNLLVPVVFWHPELHPRRDRQKNEFGRLWHCIAQTVEKLNSARRAEGRPPIPTPSRRKPSPLILKLADAAERHCLPATATSIPKLCEAALGPHPDWLLEPDALVFPRGKRRRRAKRIPLTQLERLISIELWRRNRSDDRQQEIDATAPVYPAPCDTPDSKVHGCVTDLESAEDFLAHDERGLEP